MKYVIQIALCVLFLNKLHAQRVIPLYEGKPTGSENWNWEQKETDKNPYHVKVLYNITEPALVAYLPTPDLAKGTAVIIAPGGGFHIVGIDYEAADVAKWFNAKGVAAFVLRYRLKKCETDSPFEEVQPLMNNLDLFEEKVASVANLAIQDGLKAVEYVRSHAAEYNISPQRVGMMGFSAGGTVTMGTVYRSNAQNKPDFAIPIYPYLNLLKNEKIPADAPPIFMCTATNDDLGIAKQNSDWYSTWVKEHKQVEMHLYETGNHGFALRKQGMPVDSWTDRLEEWLDQHGWLWPVNPKGFYAAFTPEQAKKLRKEEADRLKTDWAYTKRYAEENSKLTAPKVEEKRVVFLGSSRIENWKKFNPDFFNSNPNYLNRGVSGQTSSQMLLRFREDVIHLKPALVVFSGGSNDIAQNTGPTTLEAISGNVESMILLAKAHNIKFIMCSEMPTNTYPWNPKIQPAEQIIELNKLYKALADKYKLTFVDTYTVLADEQKGLKKEYQQDPVHPNKAGYLLLEPLVQKAVKSTLNR